MNFQPLIKHLQAACPACWMRQMAGFRNVAVHEYQALVLPITVNIITQHLDDFARYAKALLQAG